MTFSFPSSYLFTSNAVIDGCLFKKIGKSTLFIFNSLNRRFGNATFFRVSCPLPIIPLCLSSSRLVRSLKKRLTTRQVQVLLQQISLCLWLERVCVHPMNKDVSQAIIVTFYPCHFQKMVGWVAFKFSLLFVLKFF